MRLGWRKNGRRKVDDLGPLLIESLEAIHRENTRRPIHCQYCPGLIFLSADGLFKHRAYEHTHPSRGGDAA